MVLSRRGRWFICGKFFFEWTRRFFCQFYLLNGVGFIWKEERLICRKKVVSSKEEDGYSAGRRLFYLQEWDGFMSRKEMVLCQGKRCFIWKDDWFIHKKVLSERRRRFWWKKTVLSAGRRWFYLKGGDGFNWKEEMVLSARSYIWKEEMVLTERRRWFKLYLKG